MTPTKKSSKTNFRSGEIHSVVFFVKELRAAASWYAEVLGLEAYRKDRDFVGFNVGSTKLCFHRADKKSGTPSGSQVSYWKVDDIGLASNLLIEAGAAWHRRPITIPEGGRVCQLKDPFGNIIGLAE